MNDFQCVCVCVWGNVCRFIIWALIAGKDPPILNSVWEKGVDWNELQKHSRPYSMYHLVDAIIKVTPGSTGGTQFN